MKINRSVKEIFSKISLKSFMEIARLTKDVKDPIHNLKIFLGLKELEPNYFVSLRSGQRIPMESIHDFQQTFWDCLVRKSYSVFPSDQVIIDVGANIGCFSIYALTKNPKAKIFAFEPSSSNFKRLKNLMELNNITDQIQMFPMGVARQTGQLSLNVGVDSAYHTSFGHAAVGEKNEIIQVLSLKDLLNTINFSGTIDLLKMDCEGAEMDCLFGTDSKTLSRVRRLELEYHEWAGFSFEELTRFLKDCDFTLKTLNHNAKDRNGNASFQNLKLGP